MDQPYTTLSEVECGLEYSKIAYEYGIKITLFFTGKSVALEYNTIKDIISLGNVEVGGHTYDAKEKRKWIYIYSEKLLGLGMGPAIFQMNDIKKTINAFKTHLNTKICSWRSHAYHYDSNTEKLLKKAGISHISSDVEPKALHPVRTNGVCNIPINVIPDHDHMTHGYYTEEVLLNQKLTLDKFSNNNVYSPEEWLAEIKRQVGAINQANGIPVLLAHPICQKVGDDFEVFRELCVFLKSMKSCFVKEL